MAKDLVNNLYKFLKEDVGEDQLLESSRGYKAPESKVFAIEGRVPTDPACGPNDPEYMNQLKEKEAKDAKGDIPPTEQTEDNKDTKLEKDLAKDAPELKDNEALKDQETQGAEQKKVEKKKTDSSEGRVPADAATGPNDPEYMKALKENAPKEKELTTMSDENAAKELAAKYSGGRVIPDAQGQQYIVMVPESTELTEADDDQYGKEEEVGDDPGDVEKDSSTESDKDAESQASTVPPKSVDDQSVPKTDVQQGADVDSVTASATPDLTPDAKGKVGTSTQSPADGQKVPKDSVEDDIDLPGVDNITVKEDAKQQAGSVPKKSVDKQSVPKTDVKADAKVDDVKGSSVSQTQLKPDAKRKAGQPKTSPKQGQSIKTSADQGARVDGVKKCSCGEGCAHKEAVDEDVTATISTDDKDITVTTSNSGTTVTTTDNPGSVDSVVGAPVDDIPDLDQEPVVDEVPEEDDVVMSDESIEEMAEKMLLTGHLKTKPTLSDKEKEFVVATESVKLSEKNQKLVDEKLKALKKI